MTAVSKFCRSWSIQGLLRSTLMIQMSWQIESQTDRWLSSRQAAISQAANQAGNRWLMSIAAQWSLSPCSCPCSESKSLNWYKLQLFQEARWLHEWKYASVLAKSRFLQCLQPTNQRLGWAPFVPLDFLKAFQNKASFNLNINAVTLTSLLKLNLW